MNEPLKIRKLDTKVINRIAAGEVIQRPANALKELIENSLDAKSTSIQINVKNGGLKLLEIQDNGTGIRQEDFRIICERFTTSKLTEYEDLQNIATYGFRGEALASISHISHLTITSKTVNDICAYKAIFVDSLMQGTPKAIAGNQGTIITVEDLFYNMNIRRNALRSQAEEYQKITEIVSKYAIHNYKTGFALKKIGENNDIRTPTDSNCIENIRTIYGNSIARELIEFNLINDELKFKINGYITNVNYSTKRIQLLLFINHRLVDCQNLKKCLDQIYSAYLPKQSHPFIYLSLELEPTTLDVNVHPTKHEVHFLNEEQIIAAICTSLETKLLGSNNSRKFYTQVKLPGVVVETFPLKDKSSTNEKIQPKELIRTDAREQKLEKFFGSVSLSKQTKNDNNNKTIEEGNKSIDNSIDRSVKPLSIASVSKISRVETQLTSVLELRKSVEDNCHHMLRELFAKHVFVGCINPRQSLIQFNTKLYLCDTRKIFYELLYQFILYHFQNFGRIEFTETLSIYELALIGLSLPESGWTSEDGNKSDLAKKIVEILCEKGEMLTEYFSMEIDETGNLKCLPLLLDNYLPEQSGLPLYIIRLATEVNWKSEKDCFHTFAKETALYYSKMNENSVYNCNDWKWLTEYVVYSAIKEYFIPPKKFVDNAAILEIANLPNLYKVFERC